MSAKKINFSNLYPLQ